MQWFTVTRKERVRPSKECKLASVKSTKYSMSNCKRHFPVSFSLLLFLVGAMATFPATALEANSSASDSVIQSLGLEGIDVTDKKGVTACKVARVYLDAPAAKAGIKTDDIIMRFDGKPLNGCGDLKGFAATLVGGKSVAMEVIDLKKRVRQTVQVALTSTEPIALPTSPLSTITAGSASQTSTASNKLSVPSFTACGSGNNWKDKAIHGFAQYYEVLQALGGGFSFNAACQAHDACYDQCEPRPPTHKDDCDKEFERTMAAICDTARDQSLCRNHQAAFFKIVKTRGGDAYAEAGKKCPSPPLAITLTPSLPGLPPLSTTTAGSTPPVATSNTTAPESALRRGGRDFIDTAKVISSTPIYERARQGNNYREVIRGYQVVYRYNGRDVTVRMSNPPGDKIRVAFGVVSKDMPADFIDKGKVISSVPIYERVRQGDNFREVISGYNVTYRYNGMDVTTRLPYNPEDGTVMVGVGVLWDTDSGDLRGSDGVGSLKSNDPITKPQGHASTYVVLKPGESAKGFSFSKDGSVNFKDKLIHKFDLRLAPEELHISPPSPKYGFFYLVIWDRDKGGFDGVIVDPSDKRVVAKLFPKKSFQLIGEHIQWSPNEDYAIVPEQGEVTKHVNVIDLKRGDISSIDIGNLEKNECQMMSIVTENGSWLNEETFRFRVGISVPPEGGRLSGIKCNENERYPDYEVKVNARTRQVAIGSKPPSEGRFKINQIARSKVAGGPDVIALAQPPVRLTQIAKCLLYKCGERYKTRRELAVLEAPDPASRRIGSVAAGSKFDSLTAAWVTHQPSVIKVRERWVAEENAAYWFEPGDLIYIYASWGEGCYTVWTDGYLYGYFDEGHPPGGNVGVRKDLIRCLMIDPRSPLVESVQKGSSALWVKLKLNNGSEGWVHQEEGNLESVDY